MQYSKIQRFTSFFVLFFFLFSTTIRFPMGDSSVFADDETYKNIVSIIVNEDIYPSIKGSLGIYSKNISQQLENTKVVILPTPSDATAYEIASVNESLYFEGLKSINNTLKNGKLIGTVIVGNLNLPVAYENTQAQKTIVPYVDFEDKYFIYNHVNKKFEKNENNANGLGVEIWHGVISPNLGNQDDNIDAIKKYFSKNNDYYNGEGLFADEKGVLNGTLNNIIPDHYEPYVFYFDQIREAQAINLENYNAYEAFQENKEDIVYQRYNKELADLVKNKVLGSQEESMEGLKNILGDSIDLSSVSSSINLKNVPDIQTRHIINKTTKKFVEIFSQGSIGELRKNIHNAGRYNGKSNSVNVDFIPYIITILDGVNDEILKEVSQDFEEKINKQVQDTLQKDIYIPYKVEIAGKKHGEKYTDIYVNLLSGSDPSGYTNALDCTPFRGSEFGSGVVTLGSRGLVVSNVQSDIDFLESIDASTQSSGKVCLQNITSGKSIQSVFGGETPLNIDKTKTSEGTMSLKNSSLNNALVPVFNIDGSYTQTGFTAPNYQQCLKNNFFAYTLYDVNRFKAPHVRYQLPALGTLPGKNDWSCIEPVLKRSFNKTYEFLKTKGQCIGLICTDNNEKYFFKKISSAIEHTEPSAQTITSQIKYGISPNLPIDDNRYIDFQDMSGNYKKINYPYLFRVSLPEKTEFTYANINAYLEKYFEENKQNFGGVDLYEYLQTKPSKDLIIGDDSKTLSYLDSLIFAIYWNNLNSISAKYKFVFENYLNDQFINPENKFNIPKNKKQYEIAYLGAKGDSENMYIQMNPESKADNPYKDIVQKNAELQAKLLGENIALPKDNTDKNKHEGVFKCAPPEGVPIFEWIPAIVCWLDDMLPPTITVTESTCGPTLPLLSNEDKEYLEQCNGDVDKNGVNDCLENKLKKGSINIFSESNRIYYNKPGKITAQLFDEAGNILNFDNNTKVTFELVNIEVPKDNKKEFSQSNKQSVYSLGDNISVARKYINFTPSSLRVKGGVVQSQFTSKTIDANYYFQASLQVLNKSGETEISKESEIIKVEVRGDRLFSTLYNVKQNTKNGQIEAGVGNSYITVSEKSQLFIIDKNNTNITDIKKQIFSANDNLEKIVLSLDNISKSGNTLSLAYPLSISILDSSDVKILDNKIITAKNLQSFVSLDGIKKSGHYVIEITDANGFVAKRELDFIADQAVKFDVNMGASILESNGAITSNVLSVLDRFDNPVIGQTNTLDIKIEGKTVVLEDNNQTSSSSQIIEGYKIFRLKSLDKTGSSNISFTLKDFLGKTLLSHNLEVKVVDSIFVDVVKNNKIKVGGNTYTLEIKIQDKNGIIYKDINSRLYFNINSIYGSVNQPYFEVKNGVATVEFTTTKLAGSEVPIEIQVEGIKKIFNQSIKINHDIPAYLQLGMQQYSVEANPENNVNVELFIKDRYGNITFDQNSGTVQLEILPEYKKYITGNGTFLINKGISTLKVSATDLPGMAYFKASFNGMDAIGKINTYYYWNKNAIQKSSYNALYTTLLGAPYGDVTQENYLAGGLLFNDNRSLAVTSLLNSPYKHNDVVLIDNNGAITSVASKNDLSTDINFNVNIENSKLHIAVQNSALGNYIGKIQPVLGGNAKLELCNGNSGNLSLCTLSKKESSVILQSNSDKYNAYSAKNALYIQDSFGKKIFSIDKNGTIERKEKIYFNLEKSDSDLLQIGIFLSGNKIGTLGYNFINAEIKSTRNSDVFSNAVESLNNTILILLAGGNYAARDVYDNGYNNKTIYFNSPFDTENQLNDFSKGNISSYENFINKGGLGWSEGNKSLLQFSAGENVGESVKKFQSFSLINLGDPVVSLKKIKKPLPKKTDTLRKFDATVGKLISNKSTVETYTTFDYNNDKKEDLLLIHTNKYLEVLENTSHEKDFVSQGNLAQIFDLGSSDSVKGGDFTGDGYSDIFFVNDQGKPFILNNIKKDFIRMALTVQTGGSKIIRSEVFDMDNDGKHDIVILDEKGEINVYFGGGSSTAPKFLMKYVGNAGMPKLNSTPRTDKGALYYDGLVSLGAAGDNSALLKEAEAFQKAIQQNTKNLSVYEGNAVNTTALDSLVFVRLPYGKSVVNNVSPEKLLIENINITTSPETANAIETTKRDLTNLLSNNANSYIYPEVNTQIAESDFIKSEYAETVGVEIAKVYSGELIAGKMVDFTLTIKNNSQKVLKNIAYVEDILTLFTLDQSTLVASGNANIRYDIPGYDFMIDGFNLSPGESFTLTAKLLTAPIKYGHIQVGLFESDEVGDDLMGDILYSASHENCGETKTIFRSCGVDSNNNSIDDCNEGNIKPGYIQGTKTPKCNEENITLPETVGKNVEDTDGNGIPDYIDNLTKASNLEQTTYAQSIQDFIGKDSDGDGVPDNEDTTDSTKDFLSNLSEVEKNIDHVLAGVDNIIQGFSCGFGGGGCIATPLNWAPLAPGGDPTLFGSPIGDGLKIDEGLPVFSSLTWMWYGPYCLPSVWPISPLSEGCSNTGAGGYLGVDSPSNFFRLFATPTLTGGFGVAACFGGPARVAGYSNMPGLHPLLPGGNCIVTAMPLDSCSDDGSDGDPGSIGFSDISGNSNMLGSMQGNGYGIVNANCSASKNKNTSLDLDLVQEYLNYKTTGVKSESFEEKFKKSFTKLSHPDNSHIGAQLNEPLIQVNGQGLDDELALNIDFGSVKSGDFSDVIQIQNRRISAFPDFLMGWVTRQIEEIVTKLTDFPTVFIILPDFSGVLDFGEAEPEDNNDVINVDKNITGLVGSGNIDTVNSGIKEAYTFLSNIPLITIEQESLSVEIPWVDSNEVEATIEKWGFTIDQRSAELKRAQDAWSFGATCSAENPDLSQEECEKTNAVAEKVILQTQGLIGSLEQNLEVIKTYKDFPKKLNKLVQKKEDYLEQILCNVESISEILGGWIGQNGERFKSWVELYILIKAILKSWQLLIDVFVDYEAECYECKNERGDLMTFIWKMISAVIPQIPVIQFPKWPDIIMDLHNIRAGLIVILPEFTFGTRPILLPSLPNLYLPDVPTVSINLPELPILPVIDIPELPDLPSLPTVELPNLPPPPTLPKMFASLEGILEILKAITKAMCILKTSPFVPEWRAGDQIAFLTERQGYLPMDFLDLSLPQFSYPFVDAIKVTTFVNLEFETDFITELARQITMPLTTFSNDFTAILNLGIDDLDFSQVPAHIDIDLGGDGVEGDISYSQQDLVAGFAVYVSKSIGKLVTYLDQNKEVTVSNTDFKLLVAEALSSEVFVSHAKYNSFRNVWDEVFEYKFEKENKFIADLQKNNFDKFEALKNILHTEIIKNKELEKNLEDYIQPSFIQKVDSKIKSDVDTYNSQLQVYNQRFRDSARELKYGGPDKMVSDLQKRGEDLLARVDSPLSQYNNGKSPLAVTATSLGHVPVGNKCQEQASSPYRYNYKGLYTIEKVGSENYSYRLFDYLDELTGKEEIRNIDSDNDGDIDVIYMMNGQIFIKENLEINNHSKGKDVTTISSDDNPFYNGEIYYSSVDNFKEGIIDNNIINAHFSAATHPDIFSYRMTFSRLIDRETQRKSIVDGFSSSDQITFENENEDFSFGKNLAYIKNLGKLRNLLLYTKELINIKKDLENGKIIDISAGTKIYAGDQAFRITYMLDGTTDQQILVVSKNKFIELKNSIKIIGISGNAYIEGRYDITLRGEEIRAYKGLPLSVGSNIEYVGDIETIDPMTYVEINYYDESEALLNFSFIEKYWLYDLGAKEEKLTFSLDMDNDYVYGVVQSFKENIFSTYSNQIVLSPQKEADNIAPELHLTGIKIPVYQEKTINLAEMIYEDSGIQGLKNIIIDMDLEMDTNSDGNTKNDADITRDRIKHDSQILEVTFGKYEYLAKTKIGVTLIDDNNNISYSEIPFEIYSPKPEIESMNELGLVGVIDEVLDNEPVSLYRYRGGVVSKLNNTEGTNKVWTESGDYKFKVDTVNTGLTLEYAGTKVAEIGEKTGKITLKDFSSKINVYPSNHINNNSYYPKIEIDKNENTIYYQYLQVSEGKAVNVVENFENVNIAGMYMKFTDLQNYGYYQIPETVAYNPGAFVIYRGNDSKKEALFIIYPDGKINSLNEFYTLEYNYENNYIVLNLIDKHYNTEISQLLFSIDGGYIMK